MKEFNIVAQTDQESKVIPYLKISLGLALFVAMVSHNHLDPSPLNLLWPDEGIHNWLGLPGALVSGLLVEIFGWCGFLVPVFLLAISHKKTISMRQAFFLDIAVIMLLTIGLAQLLMSPDTQLAGLTGFLGAISNIHLEWFPGKLITILLVAGFIVRYSDHFQFNLHFFKMMQHLGAICFTVLFQFGGFWKKRFGKIDRRFKKRFSPLSTASKQKIASVKLKAVQKWALFFKILANGLLEINPFHRLSSEIIDEDLIGPLTDEVSYELGNRQLLRKTLEEFEKRYIAETA